HLDRSLLEIGNLGKASPALVGDLHLVAGIERAGSTLRPQITQRDLVDLARRDRAHLPRGSVFRVRLDAPSAGGRVPRPWGECRDLSRTRALQRRPRL